MTFLEYLTEVKDIDGTSPGPEGMIFRTLSIDGGGSYREASLRLAGLGNVTDLFESLWQQYEEAADLGRSP